MTPEQHELTDDAFDQFMDDAQVLYGLRAGDIVSQSEVDALNRLDDHWRKNADDAVAAHAAGLAAGRREAGGVEVADLLDRLDQADTSRAAEKALRGFKQALFVRAVLDNVREEIRPEVEYALELAGEVEFWEGAEHAFDTNTADPANTGDVSDKAQGNAQ